MHGISEKLFKNHGLAMFSRLLLLVSNAHQLLRMREIPGNPLGDDLVFLANMIYSQR